MKSLIRRTFAIASLLAIFLPALALADGFIVVPDHKIIMPHPMPMPHPHPVYAPLEVSYHHVTVKIDDQIARTEVDQEFINPTSSRLEGFYMFPLPKGSQIDKFSMWVDGKEMVAELLPADKARAIYEGIVSKQRDPALLEYVGREMFKARIFPIEPNSKKRVKISYSQLLKSESDLVQYLYPLNTEKFSAKPLNNVSVKVEIACKDPILSVYSPTHNIDIRRDDDRHVTVGFEEKNTKPDMDFQVFFSRQKKDIGLSLLTYKPTRGEEGYFLLLATPRWTFGKSQASVKDVVFVADTSGSMAGPKLEQLKRALQFCIASLNEGDQFDVVRFSTEAEPLFGGLHRVDKEAQAQARKFVEGFRAAGGTNIDEALQEALKMKTAGATRPFITVFLTDGRPTIGEVNEDKIVSRTKDTDATTRIFCFGIGTDLNTHLLDRITEETKAASQYVLPEEDIEVKVSSFFDKIREPVLTNIALKLGNNNARISKLYPGAIPDLFQGEQLVIFGRYSGSGEASLVVTGNVNGAPHSFVFEDKFADRTEEHPFIARLWATRRVGYLLDEVRLRGESKELKDEIVQLAREHGIVTPYTSYLIVEDEARRIAAHEIAPPAATMPSAGAFKDAGAFDEAKKQWEGFARAKDDSGRDSGWRGISNSEYAQQLRMASNAQQQQAQQGKLSELSAALPGPGGQSLLDYRNRVGKSALRGDEPVAVDLSSLSRNVGAKTFYQNGANWVDSEVQKRQQAKRVQIKFGSKEYFELLTKIPNVAAWLALGQNVQFVHGDAVYEIIPVTEEEKTH